LAEHTERAGSAVWDGSIKTLESVTGVPRTEAFARLQEVTGLDASAATDLLWKTYQPQYKVWLPFAAIGVGAILALVIFAWLARRWNDMNA
ncbi:MAG: transporter, partial [Proteobacteria bacterium]